jgi:dolichyl-phosphate-mannose--protein O-mannosyl transferase
VPPWIAPAFILCALILIVWAGFLIITLPRNYTANHWYVAWGGFDIGLGIALVTTAVAVVRRSPYAEVAAAISGTLLVCDAWFDVLTSRTTGELVQASLEAALVELPLAALCFWMATNLARAVEVARPFLRAAGFRIEGNRLVPPEESGGS